MFNQRLYWFLLFISGGIIRLNDSLSLELHQCLIKASECSHSNLTDFTKRLKYFQNVKLSVQLILSIHESPVFAKYTVLSHCLSAPAVAARDEVVEQVLHSVIKELLLKDSIDDMVALLLI